MCTGLEIAAIVGTLASAAGTAVQTAGAQKQAKAQAAARNAELSKFLDKNEALAQESRDKLAQRLTAEEATPEEALQQPQAEREAVTTGLIDRSSSAAIPLGGSAPKVVQDTASSETARTDAEAKQRAAALAKTRAFGDMIFDKGLKSQGTARDIGMIGNFSQQEQALLPAYQDLAEASKANVGSGMQFFGGIGSALGSLASGLGGSGLLGGAGKAVNPAGNKLLQSHYASPMGGIY